MSDKPEYIEARLLFGHIELRRAPPIIRGNDLLPQGRLIEYDGYGNVLRDVTFTSGLVLENGARFAWMF